MWEQFWIQNSHYVLEVFVGFLMITAAWIYLDGWLIERKLKTFVRAIGFFMLAMWSFLGAIPLGIIGLEKFGGAESLVDLMGIIGFGLVLISLLADPIPVKPGEKPIRPFSFRFFAKLRSKTFAILPLNLPFIDKFRDIYRGAYFIMLQVILVLGVVFTEPKVWMLIIVILITLLLKLHFMRGVQNEWKFFYLGFLGFSISIALSLTSLWQGSSNALFAQIFAPFHSVWILEHIVKFISALFLGIWAWGFIRFRIFPQIFSSFVALSFIIFMITSIVYTGFLLNRTQDAIIENLSTNVRTLDFALDRLKESAILAARVASVNPQVKEAVKANNADVLFNNLNALMFESETDFMLVINTGGEVLMRAEDRERFGDSLADDPVVWRALDGKAVVTTAATQGITIPTVSIRASSPIVDTSPSGELEITGVIVTGFLLDTAFVDGVKKLTNLDVTVFSNDTSSATTFTLPDSQFRLIGTRELNQKILNTVLKEGKSHTGATTILNQPFLAAYIPIKDIEQTTIGMLFTGRSQASILAVVSDTMRLTFSISVLLMIFSLAPIWWLARFISYHQKV